MQTASTADFVPIFVVGCPRSGTTLAGELLAASHTVFNGEESFFLYLMYNWEAMQRPPVAPLTDDLLSGVRDLMHNLVRSRTVAAACTHYVDHTPWHALCLESLWQVFPGARIVHVVRHPADVLLSLQRSFAAGYRWARPRWNSRALLWRQFVNAVHPYSGCDKMFEIRYEDLCAEPVEQAKALYDWAGLAWKDDVLQTFTKPYASNPGQEFALAQHSPGGIRFKELCRGRYPPRVLTALRTLAPAETARYGYTIAG